MEPTLKKHLIKAGFVVEEIDYAEVLGADAKGITGWEMANEN